MPVYEIDGVRPQIGDGCYVAPNATLIGKVRLLKNSSVWFGAVLRGDNDWITLGEDSNVQDNSVIHADPGQAVTIGAGVTIGHRAIIHSACVGDHSLIGMGAILLNGVRIGVHSLVGAGALVTEDRSFDDGKMILGAPARALRDLMPEQIEGSGARHRPMWPMPRATRRVRSDQAALRAA